MKISSILLFLLVGLQISSCKKVDEWTQFTRSFDETFTLPFILNTSGDIISLPEYIVETNSAATFNEYNTSPDLIEEVKLTDASLQITAPSDVDFNFLDSVSFYLSADGVAEVLIASKENIPNDIGQTLVLEPVIQDLSAFLVKEEITIRLEIATNEGVPQPLDLVAHVVFFIDAKILGV